MNVRVKLFAAAKELASSEMLVVDVPAGATIVDVRRAMIAAAPLLERVVPHAMFAMNAEYASDETVVPANAEIALIPPVSGG